MRVLLWDFDGTLARRDSMWSGCLVDILDEHEPGHDCSPDDFRDSLRHGFRWHRPDLPPNLGVDVLGAESAGIPAILVRSTSPMVARRAATLHEVAALVSQTDDPAR